MKKAEMDVASDAKIQPKKRHFVIILLVVILAIVVAGVIVLALHLAEHHSTDDSHVSKATYHDSDQVVKGETVKITRNEVEFISDSVRVIFDFSKGLCTYKIESTDFALDECFVISLNMTQSPSLQTLREMYTASQTDFQIRTIVSRNFEVTQVWLNEIALGDRAKNACKGKPIYFLREITENVRRKRTASADGEITVEFTIGGVRVKGTFRW